MIIDPDKPVYNLHLQMGFDQMPNDFRSMKNYRRAGSEVWEKHGWIQAKKVLRPMSRTIDRTALPTWEKESNLISRVAAALERIAPERPGLQTLAIIRAMTPEQFFELAKRRFAEASDKPAKLADIVEVLGLLLEARESGIDWRSNELGKPTAERTKRVITWEPIQ